MQISNISDHKTFTFKTTATEDELGELYQEITFMSENPGRPIPPEKVIHMYNFVDRVLKATIKASTIRGG